MSHSMLSQSRIIDALAVLSADEQREVTFITSGTVADAGHWTTRAPSERGRRIAQAALTVERNSSRRLGVTRALQAYLDRCPTSDH